MDTRLTLVQCGEHRIVVANITDRERDDIRVEIVERAQPPELLGVPHQQVRLVSSSHQGGSRVTAKETGAARHHDTHRPSVLLSPEPLPRQNCQ
jgi:hypothetical protein